MDHKNRVCNSYRPFIHGFSTITAPLTALLNGAPRKLSWNLLAEESFEYLKKAFTTVPVLKHPDPTKQLTEEGDASDVGFGAILSQHFRDKPKLHPVAFFPAIFLPQSATMTEGTRNY